ncbi:MAG TPA: hypothetical protein GXX46_10900 [Peptococcaceae bacterium]|nr:hypothetical protein [Peptococcaceae bacterium]
MKIISLILWGILIVFLLWPLIIVFWLLFAAAVSQDIYIPTIIQASITLLCVLILWGVFIGLIFKFFSKRNSKIEEGQVELAKSSEPVYPWTEIVSSPSEENRLVRPEMIASEELSKLSAFQILSYATNLTNRGAVKEAIGLFRLLLDRPDASPLLTQIAQYRLCQLFDRSGHIGRSILNKLEEGGRNA